jgi:hypothetical protein
MNGNIKQNCEVTARKTLPAQTLERKTLGSQANAPRLKLTSHEERLHSRAQNLSQMHRELEAKLCACLREIDQTRLYRKLGVPSLFQYAVQVLKLSESVAYAFITVSRTSREIPEFETAINEKSLSVAKASRMVARLTRDNAKEVIEFAKSHTSREIDLEMARRNPKSARTDRMRPLDAETFELRAQVSRELQEKIKRLESILAQKDQATTLSHVLEFAVMEALKVHDPVLKAERVSARAQRKSQSQSQNLIDSGLSMVKDTLSSSDELCLVRVSQASGPTSSEPSGSGSEPNAMLPLPDTKRDNEPKRIERRPLAAHVKHALFLRTHGRCTYVNERGERCNSDRYLHVHHIRALSQGGTDDLGNLTHLCSFHHELVHQLSFAMDGGFNWIRAPERHYQP